MKPFKVRTLPPETTYWKRINGKWCYWNGIFMNNQWHYASLAAIHPQDIVNALCHQTNAEQIVEELLGNY